MEKKPCGFSKGHTTNEGKNIAPDKCRQAVLEKYKKVIETCEITNACECPLRAYIPSEKGDDA